MEAEQWATFTGNEEWGEGGEDGAINNIVSSVHLYCVFISRGVSMGVARLC